MRTAILIGASLLIAIPITYIGTFLLTPVYWKLEPILGIELAGHSGPSDWIFEVNLVIVTMAVFVLLRAVFRKRESKPPDTDSPLSSAQQHQSGPPS
jgi:hypothetical protein